jgi:hypothetical protein
MASFRRVIVCLVRQRRRLPGALLLITLLSLTSGCGTFLSWENEGEWQAMFALPDSTSRDARNSAFVFGSSQEDEIRLCDERRLTFALPTTGGYLPGTLATVDVILARPLCREGVTGITGGMVRIYKLVGPDSLSVRASPDTGWTVAGQIEVTQHKDFGVPDIEVNERGTTETLAGTFALTATRSDGRRIVFEEGSFNLRIYVIRYRRSLS